MKQYIKVEQLAELTPKQFIELDNLIFGHKKDSIEEAEYRLERINYLIKTDKRNVAKASYIGLLRKCTIGKMIEILKNALPEGVDLSITWNDNGERWEVLEDETYDMDIQRFYTYTPELCDALWKAVKYILESRGFESE